MTTLTNPFPSWNDTGTDPDTTSGFGKDYSKGDTVEAQHFDFLWYEVESFASDVISEFDTEVIRRDGSVTMNDAFDVDGNDIEDGATTVWNSTQGTVADDSVNNSAISANAVDSNEINSDAVTGTEIASSAVSSSEIASSAVGINEIDPFISPTWKGTHQFDSNVTTGGTAVLYDSVNDWIPTDSLENDSVTVTASGDLSGGGTVSLGGSVDISYTASGGSSVSAGDGLTDNSGTFNINVSDFAGNGLEDDGSDNIDISTAGVGANELNTSVTLTWTGTQTFDANIESDGSTTIFDRTNDHVPTSALQNDSITVSGGDGLKNGGSVSLGGSITLDAEPNDFAGTGLSESSDTLSVDPSGIAGNALEEDSFTNLSIKENGIQSYEIDEDAKFAWTSVHSFDASVTDGNDNNLLHPDGVVSSGQQDLSNSDTVDTGLGSGSNATVHVSFAPAPSQADHDVEASVVNDGASIKVRFNDKNNNSPIVEYDVIRVR